MLGFPGSLQIFRNLFGFRQDFEPGGELHPHSASPGLHVAALRNTNIKLRGSQIMLRKLITGTAAAALAGTMLLGSDASSYIKTMGSNVRSAVRQEISVEFELDRIRHEVDDLLPEIRRH
ncbi:MAG TPA: hypothetical protein DIT89_16630, partial [Planctomycetaceae bacterium]|nr:hypothetical protein [Planctomycetaceae bacterium]